jgi:hypothetical protein
MRWERRGEAKCDGRGEARLLEFAPFWNENLFGLDAES